MMKYYKKSPINEVYLENCVQLLGCTSFKLLIWVLCYFEQNPKSSRCSCQSSGKLFTAFAKVICGGVLPCMTATIMPGVRFFSKSFSLLQYRTMSLALLPSTMPKTFMKSRIKSSYVRCIFPKPTVFQSNNV